MATVPHKLRAGEPIPRPAVDAASSRATGDDVMAITAHVADIEDDEGPREIGRAHV